MRFAALALTIVLGLSGVARAAEPDTYLFDVLALQPYRGNFARLVKAKAAPDWVRAASSQGEGTAVPMRTVEVAGVPYRLDHLCKVHDCAGNTLDVLWAPRGARVWAALVEGGKPPVMLGDPPTPQAKALADAAAAASFVSPSVATPALAETAPNMAKPSKTDAVPIAPK